MSNSIPESSGSASDPADGPRTSRRRSDLSRPIGHIVLEAALVAMGVVLALAANEWRQEVHSRETAEQALGSIRAELEVNHAAIDTALSYHTAIAESLRAHLSTRRTPSHRLFSRGYIAPALLQRDAWDTARQTNALAPLPYQRVLAISRIYSLLKSYETQKESSGRVIYETLFKEGPQAIVERPSNLLSILYTFLYRERELRADLEAFLGDWEE